MSEVLQLGGDTAGLERALKQAQREIIKLKEEMRKLSAETKSQSDEATQGVNQQTSAFAGLGKELAQQAIRVASLTAAYRALIEVFTKYNEIRERAAGQVRSEEAMSGELIQLAGGDVNKLQALLARANTFSVTAGVPVGRAREVIAASVGGGLPASDDATLAAITGIADPVQTVRGISKLRAAFRKGGKDLGSVEEAISRYLGASQDVPGGTFEELLAGALFPAQLAAEWDIPQNELAALVGTAGTRAQSAESGGRQVRQLFVSAARKGLGGWARGKGLSGLQQAFQDLTRGMTETEAEVELFRLLGDTEAVLGAKALASDQYAEILKLTEGAVAGNRFAATVASREAIPEFRQTRAEARAVASRELADRDVARDEMFYQEQLERLKEDMGTGVSRSIFELLQRPTKLLFGPSQQGELLRKARYLRGDESVVEEIRGEIAGIPELEGLSDKQVMTLAEPTLRGRVMALGFDGKEVFRKQGPRPGLSDDVFSIVDAITRVERVLQRREGPVMDANDGDRHAEN